MKNLQTSSMMIRNPALNGLKTSKLDKTICGAKNRLDGAVDGLGGMLLLECKPKYEQITSDETKLPLHSIIGISKEEKVTRKSHVKKGSKFGKHHETLQRIECVEDDQYNHYQKHWFSAGLERLKIEDRSREERLEITRYELKRQLKQLSRCNVGREAPLPQLVEWKDLLRRTRCERELPRLLRGAANLVKPQHCDANDCKRAALPCARLCTLHIMNNADQVLFSFCTAKFADNTQCSVPVFDISHELPLCIEHARKRDNYKLYQAKPKKIRKKAKPSAMIRPQKRTKKKKKTSTIPSSSSVSLDQTSSLSPPSDNVTAYMSDTIETIEVPNPSNILDAEISDELMTDVHEDSEGLVNDDEMVNQVLALQEPDALELATVDQVLVNQATHLLEETDITNVLSTIQADEFNDFFTVNRNGDYEPTREETEELERALAAVDNDVKSLEKLSQSQGLLDTFLDDHMVESFVQSSIVSDVFHNGFSSCGENIMVGQASRLLSLQQNSHS